MDGIQSCAVSYIQNIFCCQLNASFVHSSSSKGNFCDFTAQNAPGMEQSLFAKPCSVLCLPAALGLLSGARTSPRVASLGSARPDRTEMGFHHSLAKSVSECEQNSLDAFSEAE